MITFRQTVLFIGWILLPLSSNIFANAAETNVALGKSAEQSSTFMYYNALLAVDGIKDDNNNWQCTQSSMVENAAPIQWWKVKLGETFAISKIHIFNRAEPHNLVANPYCCGERLNGAIVKIINSGTVKWSSNPIEAVGHHTALEFVFDDFDGNSVMDGDEVKIELNTGTYLQVREVEVYGYEESPSSAPSSAPSIAPSSAPSTEAFKKANASGDPHFKTFQDIFFSYHAACDILLLNSIIHEIMVQIRTTRVDTHRQSSYSYISQAAVKIQDVILEVSADGILLINGEDSSDRVPASIADGYAGLTKTIKGTKRNIISYKVDLGNGRSIDLRSNIKTGMMYVDVDGHFSDNKGLLGPSTGEDGLYFRDGTIMDTAVEGAYNSYSQSWQVTSDEPMLFQEARFPQHPEGCSYTPAPATVSSNLRRRLTDVVEEVSKEDAMKACADAVPGDKMDFCVMDVMLTGDLDAAEDEFYYLN